MVGGKELLWINSVGFSLVSHVLIFIIVLNKYFAIKKIYVIIKQNIKTNYHL